MLGNLLGKPCCIRLVLLDVSLKDLNHLIGLLDCTLLLDGRVVAELLVGSELHLLLMLLLLALLYHTIQELYDFLHWGYARPTGNYRRGSAEQNKKCQVHAHCQPSVLAKL